MPTEYDLSRAFERIESYLIDSMMRNFKRHRAEETEHGNNWEQWQTKQLEALETYRRNNREKFSTEFAELNDKVGEMIRNTASDAAYKQERRILEAIRKGYKPDRGAAQTQAAFFKLNERKMNALVEATTHDLEKAEFAVLRRSNDAYRKAIFDAQVFMNSGSATYEQAVDMAVKDMLSAGLQCVEYSNGARHTLPDYSEMAIRTANKRAYLRGQGDMLNKYGVTTVIINRRHGACGKCADYVGMVFIDDVYAGGKPTDAGGKYPLLSDAMKSGLFHPRCKDSASPYFEGISTPPDREVLPKKAQEDLTEIERAEQKEQYGRRMEKMYRRLEKYALDPGNKKMYAGRRSQWSDYAAKWHDNHEKLLEIYDNQQNTDYVERRRQRLLRRNQTITPNMILQKHGVLVDVDRALSKYDVEVQNTLVYLDQLLSDYNSTMVSFTLTDKSVGTNKKGYAYMLNGRTAVSVNTRSFRLDKSQDELNLGDNQAYHTIFHEFAHTLSQSREKTDPYFWKEIRAIRRDYIKNINEGLFDIKISLYANKDVDEFFAEAFTQAKLSKHPSPYAKKVLNVANKYFGKSVATRR